MVDYDVGPTREGVQTMHGAPNRGEDIVGSARIDEGADVGRNDRQARVIYAAGFFDGEGHVSISTASHRGILKIGAGQKNREPLDLLLSLFGGTVYGPDPKGMYRWTNVTSDKAMRALKELLPYLRVKREQARIGIEFQEWRPYDRPRKWTDRRERGRELQRRYRERRRDGVDPEPAAHLTVPISERAIAQDFRDQLKAARL